MAASRALLSIWARHQPARITGMLGANATTRTPSEPPSRPVTIHGRRMPRGEEVRSLSLPKNGLATMATRPPTPVTSARPSGARSAPRNELIFSARVTRRGATSTRHVPVNAAAYSHTKRGPTRWAGAQRTPSSAAGSGGGSGSGPAPGATVRATGRSLGVLVGGVPVLLWFAHRSPD